MKLTTAGKMGFLVLSIMSSSVAMAIDPNWYVGGNIGQSRAKIDDERITEFLANRGYSSTITDNDHSFSGKFYSGYQFNKNFAIEGGYFNLGKFGYEAQTTPQGTLNGNLRNHGVNLDLVGILPLTSKLAASARVGVIHSKSRDRFSSTGSVVVTNPNPRSSNTNMKLGLGLQYALSDRLSLRTEAERYRIDDAVGNRGDIDMFSIGMVYQFGAKAKKVISQPIAILTPEYVPTPTENLIVVAPKPVMSMKLSADSLFDFDKDTIKPEGKSQLNDLGAKLNDLNYTQITVVGHTDRIGTEQYNQALSESRAYSVKNYLVENFNVNAEMIYATGMGETQSVNNSNCIGNKKTPALIACLQPDRRVDIEVEGTNK